MKVIKISYDKFELNDFNLLNIKNINILKINNYQ